MKYYLKKFWKKNLMIILVQLVSYTLVSLQALVQIQVFQSIFVFDFSRLIFYVIVNVLVWAVFFLTQILLTRLCAKAVWAMNNQLRRDIAATLLTKSHQEYHAQDSGEYLSWLTNGVERIEASAWNAFFQLTAYLCMGVTSLITLACVHLSLLPVSLAVAFILLELPRLFKKKMQRLGDVCAQEQAAATGTLKELLSGFDVLRCFGRQSRFIAGVNRAGDQIEKPKYEQACHQEIISSGILGNIRGLVNIFPILLVAYLSIKGIIIQAALAGTGNLFGSVSNAVEGITGQLLAIASSKAYFDRINVHADEKQNQANTPGLSPLRDAITVEHLSFDYGGRSVLQNVCLRFQKGGKYALTGPSGSGKSTLLKLLLGYLSDYQGTIRFDGRDLKDFTPEQLQEQMSYIEQDVFLFHTTIRENITLGQEFSDARLHKALQESALDRDMPGFDKGLDTVVGEDGRNLSGGQKQRVAIARALIHNRSVLLVDEGTSALDQTNADIVEKSLLENSELTLILVSHHLSPQRKAQFDAVYQIGEQ